MINRSWWTAFGVMSYPFWSIIHQCGAHLPMWNSNIPQLLGGDVNSVILVTGGVIVSILIITDQSQHRMWVVVSFLWCMGWCRIHVFTCGYMSWTYSSCTSELLEQCGDPGFNSEWLTNILTSIIYWPTFNCSLILSSTVFSPPSLYGMV